MELSLCEWREPVVTLGSEFHRFFSGVVGCDATGRKKPLRALIFLRGLAAETACGSLFSHSFVAPCLSSTFIPFARASSIGMSSNTTFPTDEDLVSPLPSARRPLSPLSSQLIDVAILGASRRVHRASPRGRTRLSRLVRARYRPPSRHRGMRLTLLK